MTKKNKGEERRRVLTYFVVEFGFFGCKISLPIKSYLSLFLSFIFFIFLRRGWREEE